MIYHVMPGDAVAGEFRKTGIAGDVIVCRECLLVGDVDAETLPEFWEKRARFILSDYGEDEIVYHETVADEMAKLADLDADAEVNLWFEYELLCSVNMWFCLWLLAETEATVYRVEPIVRTNADIWKGFGKLDTADLQKCFDARKKHSADDVKLGANLWHAYRRGDHSRLRTLATTDSTAFPHLKEVVEAEIEKDTKPKQVIDEITNEGITEFTDVFAEFTLRAGVYGFGDTQVERLLETD
ncbi:MAG: DUF1835 domain-containing protein [Pyrinomonadaceae bacterium]